MKNALKSGRKLGLLLVFLIPFISFAEVKLPSVFGDHMILQQDTKARIWGWADAREKITIFTSWGDEIKVSADKQGNWKTEIPTPAGSYTPHQIIVKGKNTIYLRMHRIYLM